ncbi:hypothetical protein BP6252_09679 [Coleophoma cylindrospora]|uniref:RRM domain-containing protein n=1 Tax=Coleophoma cylindrospora TaxID=1849047 RepID=A0A3D8QWX3_9HELO|nr:hypothetical protein BP6252_09679 [Coleophoma cylindrospora]
MAAQVRPQTNGLLPIGVSQTSSSTPKTSTMKPPSPKLKVIVRRLAPGLTEAEFTTILGEEWKLGGGKVDWFLYKPGKDSKDPSKPSRPSRAYLHLTSGDHLISLSDAVRQLNFEDAMNTFNNPCLIGPPSVEFAPYGRVPGGRRRNDARAGTIDQDPEFMAFLEGLANPTTTVEPSETEVAKPEKVNTTPLVQFLKDKKANKSKEAALKLAKKQEAKGKGKEAAKETADEKKTKDGKADKLVEKAAKETVKILNRQAASQKKAKFDAVKAAEEAPVVVNSAGKSVRTFDHVPPRQRSAVIAAANRMFKRDINMAINQNSEKATTSAKETTEKAGNPAPKAAAAKRRGKDLDDNKTPNSAASPAAAPMVLLKKPAISSSAASGPVSKPTPTPPKPASARKPPPVLVPSEGATRAFVKHANPSQGVTEALLKEAMEKFGGVTLVEIDRRKGFAYVDFTEPEGLKKAMAANPTSVAQGTVQVMERKADKAERAPAPANPTAKKQPYQPPARGGRGGGGAGRRGGRGGGRGGQGGSSESSKPPPNASTAPAGK